MIYNIGFDTETMDQAEEEAVRLARLCCSVGAHAGLVPQELCTKALEYIGLGTTGKGNDGKLDMHALDTLLGCLKAELLVAPYPDSFGTVLSGFLECDSAEVQEKVHELFSHISGDNGRAYPAQTRSWALSAAPVRKPAGEEDGVLAEDVVSLMSVVEAGVLGHLELRVAVQQLSALPQARLLFKSKNLRIPVTLFQHSHPIATQALLLGLTSTGTISADILENSTLSPFVSELLFVTITGAAVARGGALLRAVRATPEPLIAIQEFKDPLRFLKSGDSLNATASVPLQALLPFGLLSPKARLLVLMQLHDCAAFGTDHHLMHVALAVTLFWVFYSQAAKKGTPVTKLPSWPDEFRLLVRAWLRLAARPIGNSDGNETMQQFLAALWHLTFCGKEVLPDGSATELLVIVKPVMDIVREFADNDQLLA